MITIFLRFFFIILSVIVPNNYNAAVRCADPTAGNGGNVFRNITAFFVRTGFTSYAFDLVKHNMYGISVQFIFKLFGETHR
jgi:hypothetical protein